MKGTPTEREEKWIVRMDSIHAQYTYIIIGVYYIIYIYKSLVGFSASNNKCDDDARRDECKANQSIGTQVHTNTRTPSKPTT